MKEDWHDVPWATTYDSNRNYLVPWELQDVNWLTLKYEFILRKIIRFLMRRLPSQKDYVKYWRRK